MQEQDSRSGTYTTLAAGQDFRHELDIKRSRFITVLRRAGTEDAARDLVAGLRREFHDARHHCSAFVIGPDRTIQRSSDDGEPAGTAGIPMLEALLKRETASGVTDLSDVSAVVVRYFGTVMAETSYQDRHTVLRIAVPDHAAATDRILQLTAGTATLSPDGTEWVDEPLN
jgi:putative IMPACT (imprinted ancient) family translation regulator